MSIIYQNASHFFNYLTPPIIGAFIGYLTNKIAIKMLFRPLKAWRIFGIRVPMTPGVIPSKRRVLALNMGEMVGSHLLTSKEIGKALQKEKFQEHLLGLIKERVGGVLHCEFGPISTVIPGKFRSYFDVAIRAITYQLKEGVHNFIRSDDFTGKVETYITAGFDSFLGSELNAILSEQERKISYAFIETSLSRFLTSPAMNERIEEFVYKKVHQALNDEKSFNDILPESIRDLLFSTIEEQTPALLEKFADVLKEPEVRAQIVQAVCNWIQEFIATLGPMAVMASGFLNMASAGEKINQYLIDKNDDIVKMLRSDEVQSRVTGTIRERLLIFLQTPLIQLMKDDTEAKTAAICEKLNRQLRALLNEKEIVTILAAMVRDTLENHIRGGALPVGHVLDDLVGRQGVEKIRRWVITEGLVLLRSKDTVKTLDSMMEVLINRLLARPVGKLSNLLPAGVRDGIYQSVRNIASSMLATEVPGLVDSLNIRSIVAEKVDSLDLLSLERLLLSIMEEQFKYINLFGALLGFLIGCGNLVFL